MARRAKFVVTLDAAAAAPVSVDYTTQDGTAVSGEDYTPTSGTLTFQPGETRKIVYVTVRKTEEAADEQFSLHLSNPQGVVLAGDLGNCPLLGVPVPPAAGVFLDNFDGAAGTDLVNHTPDVGEKWRVDYRGDVATNGAFLTGAGALVVPNSNGYTFMSTQYLGQRQFYAVEVDFTMLSDPTAIDQNWDLYVFLTDGRPYSFVYADFYAYGGGLELYVEGHRGDIEAQSDVVAGAKDGKPFTGINPVGQSNTLRVEVYATYWRMVVNGVEFYRAEEALEVGVGLIDPYIRLELGNYGTAVTPPYSVDRVWVDDTPLRTTQPFTGNITTLTPVVSANDTLSGAAGSSIDAHIPETGPAALSYNQGAVLNGSGGVSPVSAIWGWYFGAPIQSRAVDVSFQVRWNAPPQVSKGAYLVLSAAEQLQIFCQPDGSLTYTLAITGGVEHPLATVIPGQVMDVLLRQTTRAVDLWLDGQLFYHADRYNVPPYGWAAGVRPTFDLVNSEAYSAIELLSYSVTDYTAPPGATTLLLDTFTGAAGAQLSAHVPDVAVSGVWDGSNVYSGETWVLNGAGQLWLQAAADYGQLGGNATFGPLPQASEYVVELDLMVRDAGTDTQFDWYFGPPGNNSTANRIHVAYYYSGGAHGLNMFLNGQSIGWQVPVVTIQTNFRVRLEVSAAAVKLYVNETLYGLLGGVTMTAPQLELDYQNYYTGAVDTTQGMQFTRVAVETPITGTPSTPSNEAVTPYAGHGSTLVIRDTFSGPQMNLTAHTPDLGGAWSTVNPYDTGPFVTGTGLLAAYNQTTAGQYGLSGGVNATQLPTNDCYVEVDIVFDQESDTEFMLYLRSQHAPAPGNGWGIYNSHFVHGHWRPLSGRVELGQQGDGANFVTALGGPTFQTGNHTLRMEVQGTDVRLKVDGALVLTSTITATVPNPGWCGFEIYPAGNTRLTEFRAGTL